MRLSPHFHLFLPSSSAGISLEARLYLPVSLAIKHSKASTSSSSTPTPLSSLNDLKTFNDSGIKRLIIASHPYGRLGGNLLDPVISDHLVSVATAHHVPTAVLAYNFRGVGLSGGSQPWIGVGYSLEDFTEVEKIMSELLDPIEMFRFGYSWGSLSAISAAQSVKSTRTLLIAPPITLFKPLSYFTTSFQKALESATLHSTPSSFYPTKVSGGNTAEESEANVWILYGTEDQFTGSSSFEALGRSLNESGREVKMWKVQGGDHFFRSEEAGEELERCIAAWLGP